ncbi:MAG: hypothetical protein F4087_00570 [Gemmatimonadetes bacterium]|nr:hypothetical protein [Gemmatimonadota bacterium]MYA10788.1 hypothetical protein [Gemmatimonadota bacterium]MYD15115.1 hypothetical protein [Gemmatimonadota bacterium]MYE70890.1 hypothetical protein [Gemmatimonadota bacterium]MYI64783.1 hypothetical protein [Gemmatimonadota bacterium]
MSCGWTAGAWTSSLPGSGDAPPASCRSSWTRGRRCSPVFPAATWIRAIAGSTPSPPGLRAKGSGSWRTRTRLTPRPPWTAEGSSGSQSPETPG